MPTPTTPYILKIQLNDEDGNGKSNVYLKIMNKGGDTIYTTTDSNGKAVVDLANMPNGYSVGQEILIKEMNNYVATTLRFKGKIDIIKKKVTSGVDTLEVSGGHISDELFDLTVTKEYNGTASCDTILKDIIDTYLTGYTYTNVNSSSIYPNIKWSNKPFWECIEDLCKLAVSTSSATETLKRFDCYVDDDKDFHFFAENSVENNDEAIVWNDTLLSLEGFGEKQTLVKNKIIVYGDDGTGLPIIRVSEDSDSQENYGLKEQVVTDSDINTMNRANELSNTYLYIQKNPENTGNATCFMLPSLKPGDKIWISDPTQKIIEQRKVSKFTHTYPNEQTQVTLVRERNILSLFRDRLLKDIAQDNIINPYEMTNSINLKFDDYSELSAWDSNIEIIDGKVHLASGTLGTVTSSVTTLTSNINQVHLLVVGEKLTGVVFKVSTDGRTNTLQTINIDELITVTPGKDIMIKVYFEDAESSVDSICLMTK